MLRDNMHPAYYALTVIHDDKEVTWNSHRVQGKVRKVWKANKGSDSQ